MPPYAEDRRMGAIAMTDWLDFFDNRCVAATRRIASIGVMGMLVISMITFVDIILRFVFNSPIDGFNEVVEMTMAVAIAATFPAGVAQRVHINVDFMGKALSPGVRIWLKVFGNFLLLILFLLFAWRIGAHAAEVQARDQVLQILAWPVAPFFWVIAALMALASPVQFVMMMADIRNAVQGLPPQSSHHGEVPAGEKAPTSYPPLSGRMLIALAIVALVAVIAVIGGLEPITKGIGTVMPKDQGTMGLVYFGVMWVLILFLVPLAAAMGLIGFAGAVLVVGFEPALAAFGTEIEEFMTNINLAVLPLFLMMGSFATVAGLSKDIYDLAHTLLGHKRGGLGYATIGGCAGFGALTGSSLATAVTIGRVALPEMRRRGYAPDLATGCVAAGGTLGQLVPPSAPIVIYALLVEESIGRLFIAAVIPAVIAVVFYMIAIYISVRFFNKSAPPSEKPALSEVLTALRRAWGVLFLFVAVIGGIWGGVFTVNEAAAVGAALALAMGMAYGDIDRAQLMRALRNAVGAGGAFLFALFRGKLKGGALWEVMGETTQTTAMIYALILGAITFSFFMGVTGLPVILTDFVTGLELGRFGVIALLLVIYLILGAIMDPFAMMIITVPIVAPIVADLGFDLIWWGIIMVVVVETGLITPPFGINVFVLKGIAPDVPLTTVFKGVLPFVGADIVKLILLVIFPALVLWLPSTMVN